MGYNKRLFIFIIFVLMATAISGLVSELFLHLAAKDYIGYYQADITHLENFITKKQADTKATNNVYNNLYNNEVDFKRPDIIVQYNEQSQVDNVISDSLADTTRDVLLRELNQNLQAKTVYASSKQGWLFFKLSFSPNLVIVGFENKNYQQQILFINKTLLIASLSFITLLSPIFFSPLLLLGNTNKPKRKRFNKSTTSITSTKQLKKLKQAKSHPLHPLNKTIVQSLIHLKQRLLADKTMNPPIHQDTASNIRTLDEIVRATNQLHRDFNHPDVKDALRELATISFWHQKKMALDYKNISKAHMSVLENFYDKAKYIKIFLKSSKSNSYYLVVETDLITTYFYQEKDLIQEYSYADIGNAGKSILQNLPHTFTRGHYHLLLLPFSSAKNFSPKTFPKNSSATSNKVNTNSAKINNATYHPYGVLELCTLKEKIATEEEKEDIPIFSLVEINFLHYLLECFANHYENQKLIFQGYLHAQTQLFNKTCFQYKLWLLYQNDYLVLNDAFCLVLLSATINSKQYEDSKENERASFENFIIDCLSKHLLPYRSSNVEIFYLGELEFALLIKEPKEIWSELLQEIVLTLEQKEWNHEGIKVKLRAHVGIADKVSTLPQPSMATKKARIDLALYQKKNS